MSQHHSSSHGRFWTSSDEYDIEAQQRPYHSSGHGSHRRRGRSVPRRERSSSWVSADDEDVAIKLSRRGRHRSRSRATDIDGRDMMLRFLHRGRGIVDLDQLRWAKQSIETGRQKEAQRSRQQRARQLQEEEKVLQILEDQLGPACGSSGAETRARGALAAEWKRWDNLRRKNDHEWDVAMVRRAEEDWRRSNEDARRVEEDREWELWMEEQKLGGDGKCRVVVSLHDSYRATEPTATRTNLPYPADSAAGSDSEASAEVRFPRARYSRHEETVRISRSASRGRRDRQQHPQSRKQAFEIRSQQLERRAQEDKRRRDEEDDVRRAEDIDRMQEMRTREDRRMELVQQVKDERDSCSRDVAARTEIMLRWGRLRTQWQKLLLEKEEEDYGGGAGGAGGGDSLTRGSSTSVSAASASAQGVDDGQQPTCIALMNRNGGETVRGRITFALPMHKVGDMFTAPYVWHTTGPGVPEHKDAWLVGHMKQFYSRDVRAKRGMSVHLFNTVSFAKFVRFERRKHGIREEGDDGFAKVLDNWTCTAQQFLVPLRGSSEYNKFRWVLHHREEQTIEWMTKLETLMKQVNPDHDVKIVVYLYESWDYQTAAIGLSVAIILGIAAALVCGFLRKNIQSGVEIGGALTGLLALIGGGGGWMNQFGRESPATPVGASYAYDTTFRVECIENDGE